MTVRKKFDCVELQHEGGRRLAERLAGMTLDEKVAYFAARTAELRRKQEEIRARRREAVGV